MKGASMKHAVALLLFAVILATAGAAQSSPPQRHAGYLLGTQLGPRKLAELAYSAGVTDFKDVARATAIGLAESQGYTRAYNDNLDANGNVISRDVGIWEINIPASEIGTSVEENLYDPVQNAAAMAQLHSRRGWQPWVAYTSNVYLHDTYLRRASLGVMNMAAEMFALDARAAGQSPKTPVPMLSLKQLSSFYSLYR